MQRKTWLSLEQQVVLLGTRGLHMESPEACRGVLTRVGYYHLSGYARFFQVDPAHGDNHFRAGTKFADIEHLQNLDQRLRHICLQNLSIVEAVLRASFALRFGELVAPYDALLNPATYHSTGSTAQPVDELVRADLDRSKAPYIVRHRSTEGGGAPYADLPVWVAAEVMSFGTLSKCIDYGTNAEVAKAVATDLGIGHQGFSSQVRSLVSLRNACAHFARLWNDVSKNPPSVPNNLVHRAKKRMGNFHPHSYYQVFIALDRFARGVEPTVDFLASVEQLMDESPAFKEGILRPKPY